MDLYKRKHRSPKILIIEDDNLLRHLMRTFLEDEGYIVHEAENGKAGLEELAAMEGPSLVLLDLRMPVMNGWTFLRIKKEIESLAAIPVIVTSAEAETPIDDSICAIVPKPIHFSALLSQIRVHR